MHAHTRCVAHVPVNCRLCGWSTSSQQMRPVSEQQLTPPFAPSGNGFCPGLWWWSQCQISVGCVNRTVFHYEISQHTRIREVTGTKATRISSVLIEFLNDAEAHVQLAREERSHYRSVVATAKQVVDTFSVDGQLQVPPVNACLPPASNDITMHFSFDMAQQVCTCTCIQ